MWTFWQEDYRKGIKWVEKLANLLVIPCKENTGMTQGNIRRAPPVFPATKAHSLMQDAETGSDPLQTVMLASYYLTCVDYKLCLKKKFCQAAGSTDNIPF